MEVIFKFFFFIYISFSCLSSYSNSIENLDFTSDTTKSTKILMIGNSFTFYWNLPQVLESMFVKSNKNIEVDQITIGGSDLKKHWNLHLENNYPIKKYNYIVLNDHSTNPLLNIDTCAKYLNLFINYSKANNAIPSVYGTWEYPYLQNVSKSRKHNTMELLDSLSKLNSAVYVPVGNAFSYIEKNNPEIKLYMDDNKHPSPNATYLSACVFYSIITNESPIGLPRRFEGENIDGKKIYYIITERNTAPLFQKVAFKIIKGLKKY